MKATEYFSAINWAHATYDADATFTLKKDRLMVDLAPRAENNSIKVNFIGSNQPLSTDLANSTTTEFFNRIPWYKDREETASLQGKTTFAGDLSMQVDTPIEIQSLNHSHVTTSIFFQQLPWGNSSVAEKAKYLNPENTDYEEDIKKMATLGTNTAINLSKSIKKKTKSKPLLPKQSNQVRATGAQSAPSLPLADSTTLEKKKKRGFFVRLSQAVKAFINTFNQ